MTKSSRSTSVFPRERWSLERKETLRSLWREGKKIPEIARLMGKTNNAIIGQSNRLHLHFQTGAGKPLAASSDPAVFATTKYYSKVKAPPPSGVLKPGSWQRKLGGRVEKGAWKGMAIFSLTLEERATCPRSCQQWLSCYGSHMGRAVRYAHGVRLVEAIHADLVALQRKNPRGFVVRLHILGDFMSVEYVRFWEYMLDEFPALHIFGYTARLQGPIALAIEDLRARCWDRFAIRSSGAQIGPRTKVIASARSRGDAIICPAQTDKTSCCSSCGLCWAPAAQQKVIAFLAH